MHTLRLVPALGLATLVACTSPSEAKPAKATAAEAALVDNGFLTRAKHPEPNVWVSGQPSLEDLQSAKAAGVKVVANLRGVGEPTGFSDEKKTVEGLGLRYTHIPVSGVGDITMDKAEQLEALLKQTKDDKVLLHCASGNRIGALMALIAFKNGKSVDEAMTAGTQAGLRGLAPVVQAKLQQLSSTR